MPGIWPDEASSRNAIRDNLYKDRFNPNAKALKRSEAVLSVSERLMDLIAGCGVYTPDTPYIEQAQKVAGQIGAALEQAIDQGRISLDGLFDEH